MYSKKVYIGPYIEYQHDAEDMQSDDLFDDEKFISAFVMDDPPIKNGIVKDYLIPNFKWSGSLFLEPKYDPTKVISMNGLRISDEILVFEKHCYKDLKKIKDVCGNDNVEVKFGMILY